MLNYSKIYIFKQNLSIVVINRRYYESIDTSNIFKWSFSIAEGGFFSSFFPSLYIKRKKKILK